MSHQTRLRHWFGLDCSPLRRRSDVVESVVRLAGVSLVTVSVVPALALSLSAETVSPTASVQPVPAIVEESHDSVPLGLGHPSPRIRVPAHWKAPNGTSMSGHITVSPPIQTGDEVVIDVDADGRPAQPAQLRWSGSAAGWLMVLALAGLWVLSLGVTHLLLMPVRRHYWTQQLATFCAAHHRHPQP